jgi:diguanylate cyclase (GGDEF)-like protein
MAVKTLYKLILLACFFASHAYPSEMRFSRITIEQGLQQETIRSVYQDQRGFIWIATEEGLSRFDGFNFKHFISDKNKPDSISDDVVTDIKGSGDGGLWVATFGGGLNYFDPTKEAFTNLNELLPSTKLKTVFVDSQRNIWVGSYEQGVTVLQPQQDSFILSAINKGIQLSHASVMAITEDQLGRIWIGTDGGGLDIYDPGSGLWSHIQSQLNVNDSLSDDRIRKLLVDHNGFVWVATAGGLNKYSQQTNKFVRFKFNANDLNSLSNDRVLSLLEDSSNRLWVGTDAGINLFENDKFQRIQHDPANPTSLSNDRVLDIYEDEGGVIWFGTYQGLNKWNPAQASFNHTLYRAPNGQLKHNIVTDFAESISGNTYIATYGGGVLVMDAQHQIVNVISKDSGLPDNQIMAVLIDRDDNLWVGSRSQGLARLDAKDHQWTNFIHVNGEPDSLLSNSVSDIRQDSQGNIWIATYNGGLSKLLDKGFKHYRADDNIPNSLSSNRIFQIFEDSAGFIWLATEKGLNRLNPNNDEIKQLKANPDKSDSLSSNMVWHIFEDRLGNFWVATQGKGINLWKKEDRIKFNNSFEVFNLSNGFNSNTSYGIEEDGAGNIWFSSNRGLSRFNYKSGDIQHYDKSHGLQGYDFNIGAIMKDKDGILYFGGSNGFNYFDPLHIAQNNHTPQVVLTGITKGNQSLAVGAQSRLELTYTDYLLALDFIALDYAAPEKNRYQYSLQNFDADWIDVGQLKRATYTNLPAGRYLFKVRAANNDGVWSEASINLPISVFPAPWRTWWAYTLYATGLGLIIFMFLRRQMEKLAHEETYRRQLEKEVDNRTSELAGQNKALTVLNDKLETAYLTDAMTGLNNRHFLDSYLRSTLPQLGGNCNNGDRMLVMLIDMDNLKPVNDSLGHAAGDAVISHMAGILTQMKPEGFHLIRWGGDEFMFIGIQKEPQESQKIVERLFNDIIKGSFVYQGKNLEYGCSAGFAHYPFDSDNPAAMSWDQVAVVADKALYAAKKTKGNSWVGVMGPKREINELFISQLLSSRNLKEEVELVDIIYG